MSEPYFNSGRVDVQSSKPVGPQISQKHQNIKCLNTPTSFFDKCNMNSLEDSLPKFPLSTIWTNNNSVKDFARTLPLQNNIFKKPFSLDVNFTPHTAQNTNNVLKSKFQNKTQDPLNFINISRYFKSSFSHSMDQKLNSIAENTNASYFTSLNDESSTDINQNGNSLESSSFSCINQSFNMNIWKDDQFQPPKM